MTASMEMPKYQCHKIVHALKISGISNLVDGKALEFERTDGVEWMNVAKPADWILKHSPRVGGYYVVYEDGYSGWSPAEAFESGCTRVVDE